MIAADPQESRKLFPFQTDKFRVAHDPKTRTVVLMSPNSLTWHLRAQERGDTKRKAAKGAR